MTRPIPDSYWVKPGELIAGEYAGAFDPDETEKKLAALLDAGVRSFLDLTERHELEPYEPMLSRLASSRGMEVRYRRMSIQDRGVPTTEHMQAIIEHARAEIAAGRPVYVHCWGGIGRTGTVVGCWMREQDGLTAEESISRIATLRAGTPDGSFASPETREQRTFIASWAPRLRQDA